MEETIFQKVVNATNIKEGEEAIRAILLIIFREGRISTKTLSQKTNLPIPVVSAVRRELEKEGILARKGGAILTDDGLQFLREILQIKESRPLAYCKTCKRTGIEILPQFQSLLEKLKTIEEREPPIQPEIDQSRCTNETKLRRALLLDSYNDIEGRNLAFIGDGDLISITTALIGHPRQLVVFDIDKNILNFIEEYSHANNLNITTVHHDLRQTIASEYNNQFDVFVTDPPYTCNGFELFVSRGVELLRKGSGKHGYISFSHKPPNEKLNCQQLITNMKLILKEIIPNFNQYRGAEILGQTGQMLVVETTSISKPIVLGEFTRFLYSGEERLTKRLYRCVGCGTEYKVGQREKFSTIEELKGNYCTNCGKNVFQRIKRIIE